MAVAVLTYHNDRHNKKELTMEELKKLLTKRQFEKLENYGFCSNSKFIVMIK